MSDNIVSLADRTNDNRMISVEQLLKDVYEEVASDDINPTRAIVILLHDADNI